MLGDLPEHLLPDFEFKPLEKSASPDSQAVGLLEPEDQRLIDVMTDPKHKSALEILLAESRETVIEPDNVIPTTTPDEDNLAAYLESTYWLRGGYPLFSDLMEETGFTESYARQTLVRVSDILVQRGLPLYVVPTPEGKSLFKGWTSKYDPRFVLAAGFIANVTDKRTVAAKLDEIEVSPAEWDGWLTNSDYYEYYKLLIDRKWSQSPEVAKVGIMRGLQMGDLRTIQYYHEFTGQHVNRSEITVNTSAVIMRVIEILSKHLEPEMLNKVANELVETTAVEIENR